MKSDFLLKKIGMIFLIFLALAGCKSCAGEYAKGADEEAIKNFELIKKEKAFIQADVDETYKERTIRVVGIPTKFYDITYSFIYNGQVFTGSANNLSKYPDDGVIKVYYSTQNPKYNSTNPWIQLQIEEGKKSNTDLYFAIFWGIVSFLMIVGIFADYKEFKLNYKE